MGVSGEPPAPYGKYQNVFLTESEYAELKQEYPDCLERLIEEMSRYIASSGNDYVSHAATLYRWRTERKRRTRKRESPIILSKRARAFSNGDTTPCKQGVQTGQRSTDKEDLFL